MLSNRRLITKDVLNPAFGMQINDTTLQCACNSKATLKTKNKNKRLDIQKEKSRSYPEYGMCVILASLLTCYSYIWCDASGNRTILDNRRSPSSIITLSTTSWIKSPLSPPTTTGTTPDPGRHSARTTSGTAGWDGYGAGNSLTDSTGVWLSESGCRGRVGVRRIPNSHSGYTLVEFKVAECEIVLDTFSPRLKNGIDKPSTHDYGTFVRTQHEDGNK